MLRTYSHTTTVSQIKEQLEVVDEEVENADVVITTLNGLPWSWDSFIRGMFPRRKWLLSADSHNKRREDRSNWRSSAHNSKKIPQAMRNMKNSILEEHLIHIENLDKKWCCYRWRRWWIWKKESTHEKSKDKYSISISWYCFVMHLFIFSWCVMHDRMFALMIVYY